MVTFCSAATHTYNVSMHSNKVMKKLKIACILFLLIITCESCGQNNTSNQSTQEPPKGSLATAIVDYDTYLELRSALLDINPADFGIEKSETKIEVFGIIIDLNKGDSITTISAYKTGDVSVYNSTGMLYMAGVQVPRFKEMALDFTNNLQNLIAQSTETNNRELPKSGFVKFYLVTNNGLRNYENEIISIEQSNSDWKMLIDKSLEIVNEYKKAVEK